MTDQREDGQVPFPARRAMQDAIWQECIAPADNEWTTWTDSIALAECAANALTRAGWRVVPLDTFILDEVREAPSAFPPLSWDGLTDAEAAAEDATWD